MNSKEIKSKRKIKISEGLKHEPIEKFIQFGKYVIHNPKLKEGVFNLRYKSGANHKKFPVQNISNDYKNFLNDFINKKTINNKLFDSLTSNNQIHFKNLLRESGLSNDYKVKINNESEEKNDHLRFELLQGQIIAGQNNVKVIEEFKNLIQKFLETGKLNKSQVKNALSVLDNVSK
jgi:hypothetical protein